MDPNQGGMPDPNAPQQPTGDQGGQMPPVGGGDQGTQTPPPAPEPTQPETPTEQPGPGDQGEAGGMGGGTTPVGGAM